MEMDWFDFVLGGLAGGSVVFILAVIYIVVNRLHPAGKAEIIDDEALRAEEAWLRQNAEICKEAMRLYLVDREKDRLEETGTGAQR